MIFTFPYIQTTAVLDLELNLYTFTTMGTTSSPDRQMPEEYHEPRPQLWFSYSTRLGRWVPPARKKPDASAAETATATVTDVDSDGISSSSRQNSPNSEREPGPESKFLLITWNIDALIPHADERMTSALRYLRTLAESPPEPFRKGTPVVIMLQEMLTSDLTLLMLEPWVKERFVMTDLTRSGWVSNYGTVMLIDRGRVGCGANDTTVVPGLEISNAFRVRWESKFGRDGLFVDLVFPPATKKIEEGEGEREGDGKKEGSGRVVRLCNTHLESLACNPPVRPQQASRAAAFLHQKGIHGAIMAGDMNAIQPSDRHIAEDNDLIDAYLALGGQEDHDDGYTWGYQSRQGRRERFGCCRMDKVLYSGGLAMRGLQRIGIDVCIEDDAAREDMKARGMGPWVTDHYGLMVEVEVLGGYQ